MPKVLFATGNKEKFNIAQEICQPEGVELTMFDVETHEIQSEDSKEVTMHKLEEKFSLSNKMPVLVSDDSWEIPGLKGFPGPYMKSIDEWFTPQNMLDLMRSVDDRTIILHQYLAYKDSKLLKLFHNRIYGYILEEPKGSYGKPIQKVVGLKIDNGLSISEVYDISNEHDSGRFRNKNDVWPQFINWYKTT